MTRRPPSPIFPGVDPDVANDALGIYLYFTRPEGVIFRYAGGKLTDPMARWIDRETVPALRAFFPGKRRFVFVQDLSTLDGYETEARKTMTAWGVRIKDEIVHTVLIPPPMTAMIKMAINTAVLALRVVGVKIELEKDLAGALAKHGLRPA